MREGIRSYLGKREGYEIVGEAGNGQEAIDKALSLQPDVIIMDCNLPAVDGLEATRRVRQIMPAVRVLVLILRNRGDLLLRAQTAGAHGCLTKDSAPGDLIHALESLREGRLFYPASFTQAPNAKSEGKTKGSLTARQTQVVQLLAEGLSNKEAASHLGISVRTVEKHRENILGALGMHNLADLVRFAVGEGLVSVNPAPGKNNAHPTGQR